MDQLRLRFPSWVGVVCGDLAAQRRFYRETLGFREMAAGEGWVQFELGEGMTFELLARSNDPEYDASRYQVGFEVDDISSAASELIARGVEAITDVKQGADRRSSWAYFKDPEGNVFEITQR